MGECCKSGFLWNGTPTGKEITLGKNKAYVAGTNKDVAVLIVHDIFGNTTLKRPYTVTDTSSQAGR